MPFAVTRRSFSTCLMTLSAIALIGLAEPVQAQVTAFKQAVAEASYGNEAVATFYRTRGYAPIFTGEQDGTRRAALLAALETADIHGLPAERYDPETLKAAFAAAETARDRGRAEVLAAKMFLQFSTDIQTGAMTPGKIDSEIVRQVPRRDPVLQLQAFAKSSPQGFMKALPPGTQQYNALLAEKLRLEATLGHGGWGPKVSAGKLEPGQSGEQVVALRNRLIAMGFMKRSASGSFDGTLQKAVQQFQIEHGLEPDGIAGPATLAEINIEPQQRLSQVIVAMERERWSNVPLGERHILVNITEYTARIIDNGKETFSTRVVVGSDQSGRRTPEFSDVMEYMVINPTWNVPRSIATKEYLPLLKKNPNAVSHLRVVDSRGRTVSRGSVNFAQYTASSFPFSLKQPPSQSNALGLVKFMFPNPYNIYLHDTPSKNLFARDQRAFSHGCVRLAEPFEFAYALLARQTSDPEGLFHARLNSGSETRVNLEEPVPVHLQYRTAFATAKGRISYRPDIYGRDARIWAAMQAAGVKLGEAGS
ncbi:L,D-transpeptidase family protein [Tropicimonas sediminicola]|uniref:Murein L,D-transpeptidase YcbB/YkuD n=1 Tax=Tropicimonas sediminicola TaxID=1031541 RepID=A0A239EI55_9RHOB|nr:L,D-transpeptidase family protein [Tropicimonas sediminicola]SNS43713.1 Murein L,D-transpeptidase YcbB/YkuD [Tropicimonas sediminicola]